MATSARELLVLAQQHAGSLLAPTVTEADAAITALHYVGRQLHRLNPATGVITEDSSVAVDQLTTACRTAGGDWPAQPGRLPDLVGAACDIIARTEIDPGTEEWWALAVHLSQAARRCVEVALHHVPYRGIPILRSVHGAAITVEQQAARRPPAPRSGQALDVLVPALDGDRSKRAGLDELARLLQALQRDAARGRLPVAAALATAAAAEAVAIHCVRHARPGGPEPWRHAPASWQVVQAALIRFEDGSRRKAAPPTATVAASMQLRAALPNAAALDARAALLLAAQLPALAGHLRAAVSGWATDYPVYARAQNLVRRAELVEPILAGRVVPAGAVDIVPVLGSIRVAERLSTDLAAALSRNTRAADWPQHALELDARWVDRLTRCTTTPSPPATRHPPPVTDVGTPVSHVEDVSEHHEPDTATLRAATTAAAEVFTDAARRHAATAYLRQRGIDATQLGSQWVLGYAPPGWTRLVDKLTSRFDAQALIDTGVARRSSRGTLIDTFRDRVIFGIHAADGTLTGFIGRDLSGDPNTPKYLNTRQHALFDKSSLLFGLHEGTRTPRGRQIVLVEGPLDVLAIAIHPRADGLLPVAACGTALTAAHVQRIAEVAFQHQTPVVVAMDGDRAGRTAALAAGARLHHAGLDVRIASLPAGTDPADLLAGATTPIDTFRTSHAVPLLTVYAQNAIADQGDAMRWVEGRLAALRNIARHLATYPPSYTARQIGWLADTLHLDPATVTLEAVTAYRGSGFQRSERWEPTGLAAPSHIGPSLGLGRA